MSIFFWRQLAKKNYDFAGTINEDSNVYGYAKDGVFHVCNETTYLYDRKEIGLSDNMLVLYDTAEGFLHIAQDKEEFSIKSFFTAYVIDSDNKILTKSQDFISQASLIRINSNSLIVLESEELKDYILEKAGSSVVKRIYWNKKTKEKEKQHSIIILNGIIYEGYSFLMCYNDYYFFLHNENCVVYHSENGIIHEGKIGLFWALPNNKQYIIEEKNTSDSITVDVMELYPKVCNTVDLFKVTLPSVNRPSSLYFISPICSNSYLVCSIGVFHLLVIHRATDEIITHNIIHVLNSGCTFKLINDSYIVCDYYNRVTIVDVYGELMGDYHKPSYRTPNYMVFKKKDDIGNEYYGIVDSADFHILIPPIYSNIEALPYYSDYGLYEVELPIKSSEATINVKGVVSAKHGQVVPFGCKYEFAKYYNSKHNLNITSDEYLIYENNGFKGLVYKGQDVLSSVYDDIIGFEFNENLGEYQGDDRYINGNITSQWAPDCVLVKKDNLWGLYSKGDLFVTPSYETIIAVKTIKKNYLFTAIKDKTISMLSSIDGLLFSLSSSYSFLRIGIGKKAFVFVFKSSISNEYVFYDYSGNQLKTSDIGEKGIKVFGASGTYLFMKSSERFYARPRPSYNNTYYDDSGYTQEELNDMYRDAFDGNPEYESNID